MTTDPTPGLDLRALALAGQRRDDALEAADRELDAIVRRLMDAPEAEANLSLAAKLGNVSRTTLYRRLAKARAAAVDGADRGDLA